MAMTWNVRTGDFANQIRATHFPGRERLAGCYRALLGQPAAASTKYSYDADGLATIHNCDFMNDPLFRESYQVGINTGHQFGPDLHIEWRVFVTCWAAMHATHLRGDFVECGVNTGIYSRAIMHYIGFDTLPERRFYLLDTYEGIPKEQLTESELQHGQDKLSDHLYSSCLDLVIETFSSFSNAIIIPGKVPDTLSQVLASQVAYLSIDMNVAAPEIAAGEYFWPRLVPGAMVILDDYGFFIDQKRAWDQFADQKGVQILSLPTGQGLIVKPPL